ncbi:MAG: helix-turn-helix domain-containing protein [Armatimonadetes bacterium]|nr:helix-turn-helix domain-containing protein [Armatimonadota bacterium]
MKKAGLNHAKRPGGSFKFLYSIEECAELLSLSRSQLYRLADQGDLESVKIGKSRRVTYTQLDAFVMRLEQSKGFTVLR